MVYKLIIINDDINNRPEGIDFQIFIEKGGELFLNNGENLMHNKFCIIDDKILINGSYNWTYYAESRNFENVVIHYNNDKLINDFSIQFTEIINLTEKVDKYIQNKRTNVLLSTNIDYILKDSLLQGEETGNKILSQKISELQLKRNEKIIQDIRKDKVLRRAIGIGLKDDKFQIVLPKNSKLPIKRRASTITAEDNQKSCYTAVYYGENNKSTENSIIGTLFLENLPEKPAGQVNFTTTMELNGSGLLKVTKIENGTTNKYEEEFNIDYLVD